MSIEAMAWVWKLSQLNPSQKILMLALADAARDADFFAWPSRSEISRKTGMEPRTITRHVATLTDLGLLEVVSRGRAGGGRTSNGYYLPVGTLVPETESPVRPHRGRRRAAPDGFVAPAEAVDADAPAVREAGVATDTGARSPRSEQCGQVGHIASASQGHPVDNQRLRRSEQCGQIGSIASGPVDNGGNVANGGHFNVATVGQLPPYRVLNPQGEPSTATPAAHGPVVVPAADATGAAAGPLDPSPSVDAVAEQAVVRDVRATLPRALGDRLSAGPLLGALRPLLEAGWSRQDLVARLEARSWADAGPGLVISVLRDLALEGPPVAAPVQVAASRCQDHGTADAATCSPCWSEIKLGEREAAELGRASGPARASTRSSVHAAAAREQIRSVAGGPR